MSEIKCKFTEVKSPDLVDSLTVSLAPEDDHDIIDLDGGVRVEAAWSRPTADRVPAPGH